MYKIKNGIRVEMTADEISEYNTKQTTWNNGAFDRAMKDLRIKRDNLLTECDWTQSPDSPLTDANKTEWATYRQALRDITNGLDTVEKCNNVTWPTKP